MMDEQPGSGLPHTPSITGLNGPPFPTEEDPKRDHPVDRTYALYVHTYEAVADGMRRNDVSALRKAFLASAFLAGPAAVAAVTAQVDAANRFPMCAKTHLLRLLGGPRCPPDCRDTKD